MHDVKPLVAEAPGAGHRVLEFLSKALLGFWTALGCVAVASSPAQGILGCLMRSVARDRRCIHSPLAGSVRTGLERGGIPGRAGDVQGGEEDGPLQPPQPAAF